MKNPSVLLLSVLAVLVTSSLSAQTQIGVTLNPNQATQVIRIAVPFPDLGPSQPTAGAKLATAQEINDPLFAPLTRDLQYSGIFAIAPLPPAVPLNADLLKRVNAQYALKLNVYAEEQEFVVEARLYDGAWAQQFGKRYRGTGPALTRVAHTIASDLVRMFNGKPAMFLSQIAFSSNRDGNNEIYLMDWDGGNQRRITYHNSLSILPSWSPDNERLVYTSFGKETSDMYIINRRGGGRIRIQTGLALNTSATFSPVGNDIAFVGSVRGNPDIYIIKDDGTNLRRVTTSPSVESTPEWSPNGRQLSFTSGRSGSPQIYVSDAEGADVRRISFEGEWNDDATWSPDGEQIAYTSKVGGRFQIRIANLVTGQSRVVAGEGNNEQPTWSPDGQWIAFQSNRSGRWQIYRMRVDGSDLLQLTFAGENKDPDWSKKLE